MNPKLPEDTITMENVEKIYDYVFAPYVKQLKLSFLSIKKGKVVARLENSKDYQFVTGALSGQILMSVIDTVCLLYTSPSPRDA